MKKLLFTIIMTFFLIPSTFATDACDKFVPVVQNFVGEVTMVARFRDYPCTYKSNIIGSSKIGDRYNIIRRVDGWYEIEFEDGTTTWIWDQAIKKVPDNTLIITTSGYTLTIKDRIIVNKFIYRVNLIFDEKGSDFKDTFLNKLEEIILNKTISPRIDAILYDILMKLKNIQEENIPLNNTSVPESIVNNLSEYNIDFDEVKNTWLGWNNVERAKLGKYNYKYNLTLEKTAFDWAEISKNRGEITHKRDSEDSYYDYNKITNWLADRGVICKNVNKVTHTENIGWGTFSCSDGECTHELINGIESTFKFYMSEKNKDYKPHYLSLMNNYFNEIGLGIALSKGDNNNNYKYYLTVHYCTELVD